MELMQFNQSKILHHIDNICYTVQGENPFPVSIEIDASNYCNHSCYCCAFGRIRREKASSIPRDILMKAIKEFKKGGVKSITFTGGGEPLMNKATLPALRLCKSLGIKAGLITNGALLNDETIEFTTETCEFVRISLDAASNKVYTLFHRPKNLKNDNFDIVINNIANLVRMRNARNKDMTIGVAFVVTKLNYKDIEPSVKLARNLGVDYFQLRPALSIEDNTFNKMASKIWNEKINMQKEIMNYSTNKFSIYIMEYRHSALAEEKKNFKKCLIHQYHTVMGADSSVYLCCFFRGKERYKLGDLKKESFYEIWNGSKRRKVINSINLKKCPPCRFNRANEILNYIVEDTKHKEFI